MKDLLGKTINIGDFVIFFENHNPVIGRVNKLVLKENGDVYSNITTIWRQGIELLRTNSVIKRFDKLVVVDRETLYYNYYSEYCMLTRG